MKLPPRHVLLTNARNPATCTGLFVQIGLKSRIYQSFRENSRMSPLVSSVRGGCSETSAAAASPAEIHGK